MKTAGLVALIVILAAGLLPAYQIGKRASLRECPPDQQGAKLLYSEQRSTGTVCSYAARWDGHGRTIKRKTL